MNKADKMFKDLGYKKKIYEDEEFYKDNDYSIVGFWYKREQIEITENIQFMNDKTITKMDTRNEIVYITMKELQAINEKCKELGWIE